MALPTPEWHASLDSTNSYLLRRFEADERLPDGFAAVAGQQTAGRGQRNRKWAAVSGKSLLFSVGARPVATLLQQPLFSFGVAVTVAETLVRLFDLPELAIKWPNDLYLSYRKLGGILVENTLRGSRWHLAVVGVGLNLFPQPAEADFKVPPAFLADYTSTEIHIRPLALQLQQALTAFMTRLLPADIAAAYNHRLYRRHQQQTFETAGVRWSGLVREALPDGRLRVLEGNQERFCIHGHDLWIPEKI